MPDCIFCKIITRALPANKVYEDDDTLAFLDIHPVNRGHTLVVSKKHYPDFINTPPEVLANLMAIIQKITPAILEATGASSFNISINNGRESGQVISHTHIHIIPRAKDDGLSMWPEQPAAASDLEILARKIKEKIV
ncbi:MAG: HIT family protein [Patescibacteria group bacterium]